MSIFYGCQVHAGKTQALVPRALAADEGSEAELRPAPLQVLTLTSLCVPASCKAPDGTRLSLVLKIDDAELCAGTLVVGRVDMASVNICLDSYAELNVDGHADGEIHVIGHYAPLEEEDGGESDPREQLLQQLAAAAGLGDGEEGEDDEEDSSSDERDGNDSDEEEEEDDDDSGDEGQQDEHGLRAPKKSGRARVTITDVTHDIDGTPAKRAAANGKARSQAPGDADARADGDDDESDDDDEEEAPEAVALGQAHPATIAKDIDALLGLDGPEATDAEGPGAGGKGHAAGANPGVGGDADGSSETSSTSSSGEDAEVARRSVPEARPSKAVRPGPAATAAPAAGKQKPAAQAAPAASKPTREDASAPGKRAPAAAAEPSSKRPRSVQQFKNGFEVHQLVQGSNPNAPQAKPGKTVFVKYRGTLRNGKVFDETRGSKTFKFRLGVGEVIKGWDKGVAGMRVGDKRKLIVPPSMAYGVDGVIPKNATLNFEVELCNVR